MPPLPQPILVTGASGLLGSAILTRLAGSATVTGLGRSHAFPNLLPVNLTDPDAIDSLKAMPWNALVHCAAYRDPDFCETHPEDAAALNTNVPARLAALAQSRGAPMVHISTDYVFDGDHPPYRETSTPCPINRYGQTKRDAETRVLQACPGAAILRIPALYGTPPPPVISSMIEDAIRSVTGTTPTRHDHACIRYPTCTADIADVVAFLLEKGVAGIVHASATVPATRYEFTLEAARILHTDPSLISPMDSIPPRAARRPVNSALTVDRLASLGGPIPKSYQYWLPLILADRVKS